MLQYFMTKIIIIIIASWLSIISPFCLDNNNQSVKWWVILKVPPLTQNIGFAYYDSKIKTGQFQYHPEQVDRVNSALTNTINNFNLNQYSYVSWNDQHPSGKTSSSAAHSKGLIGFSLDSNIGFFITHSIPKYPEIINGKINPIISPAQQIYGQNIMCLTLSVFELQKIAENLILIRPYVYDGSVIKTIYTQNLYKLSIKQFDSVNVLFKTYNFKSVIGYNVNSIYKHHVLNGSIFEDGLTNHLNTKVLLVETWGRPLEASWCNTEFSVLNVMNVTVGGSSWKESQDHSKWLLAGDQYACFGDMNRMPSQWKRGGSFYCLEQSTLITALSNIIVDYEKCQ